MDTRNTVEITVGGRRYKLSGSESEAYMQKVADYVNGMYEDLKKLPGFTSKSHDYQTLMMYLNLADSYLKKSGWTEEKQAAANAKAEEEIYRLKMELVEARKQSEALEVSRNEETGDLKKRLELALEEKNRLTDREKESRTRLGTLEKELDAYKTETAVLKRKAADYEKNARLVEQQLKDAAARERDEKLLRNKYETQLEKQKVQAQEVLDQTRREQQVKQEEIQKQRKNLEEKLQAQTRQLEETKEQLRKQTEASEVEKEQFRKQAEAFEVEKEQLRKQQESLTTGSGQLEEEVRQLKERLHAQAGQQEELKVQLEEAKKQLTEPQKQLEEAKKQLIETQKQLEEAKKQLIETQKQLKEDESDLIEYLDLMDEKDREIASLRFKMRESSGENYD